MDSISRSDTKKCIIVGAGDFFGFPFTLEDEDFLIAADAGYLYLKSLNLCPHLIVGDFDSMHVNGIDGHTGNVSGLSIFSDAEKAEYLKNLGKTELDGIEVLSIDPVKNDPDLLTSVRLGIEKGYREFHLLGASGGRIDHTMANVQILNFLSLKGLKGYLYTERQILTAITDSSAAFTAEMDGYFSALSLSDHSYGVTEKGFKYIINDVTLNSHTPTGLSNEFVGKPAEISVRKGTLLLIYDLPKA